MAKALGTTDAITTCDCCGKSGLKLTVAIELDDGEIVHYGSTCAARNTGKTQPQIKREISDEAARKLNVARAEWAQNQASIAYRVKMEQSRRAGLVGRAFLDANAIERVAEQAAAAIVAQKHGVQTYQL